MGGVAKVLSPIGMLMGATKQKTPAPVVKPPTAMPEQPDEALTQAKKRQQQAAMAAASGRTGTMLTPMAAVTTKLGG